MNSFIEEVIKNNISPDTELVSSSSVSGGCINSTYQITTSDGRFFLKWNRNDLLPMFDAEEQGLAILHKHSSIHVPAPLGKGVIDQKSYLLTEWVEKGPPASNFWKKFGHDLAAQHQITADQFGLDHNNFIGSLSQSNMQHTQWADFFINERLIPQLKLASSRHLISPELENQFQELFKKLAHLVPEEKPALLHGDLWSGNFMTNHLGEASIFDPAVHYGHRETELAFTHLFGGFSPDFYQYYNEAFHLEPGFDDRIDIHNLYPLLVHVNLFGSSYLSGIKQTLNRYC